MVSFRLKWVNPALRDFYPPVHCWTASFFDCWSCNFQMRGFEWVSYGLEAVKEELFYNSFCSEWNFSESFSWVYRGHIGAMNLAPTGSFHPVKSHLQCMSQHRFSQIRHSPPQVFQLSCSYRGISNYCTYLWARSGWQAWFTHQLSCWRFSWNI